MQKDLMNKERILLDLQNKKMKDLIMKYKIEIQKDLINKLMIQDNNFNNKNKNMINHKKHLLLLFLVIKIHL